MATTTQARTAREIAAAERKARRAAILEGALRLSAEQVAMKARA